ncbi:hypothetical protein SPRG_18867 [Saprolegnia parasitica CBS 223.65]|uniref:Lipoxygenase domain-containing protein n=1 Tax=Saprolegnia parasitica (strain CBS 223.65) TaxID=695850 RepID=A0A067CYH1_SAPPC|nr:hypothetical protein SPRG_18867 [Saprolegnia parasitica CBS 223.65]KDO35719.1 hypothetical protein SPRG_18867 [Saprolegnia parasitica CBS 223.65]|eukprot:XP_012194083.1 hypothetical protein SPRG_18867 [Saprolegnia parasitica CBS 223.65]
MVSIPLLLITIVGQAAGAPQGLGSVLQGVINDVKHSVAGVRYAFESLVDAEPVTGFCSPEALRAFDDALISGALERRTAYPAGILELSGPTLSTIDGPAFSKRQDAFLNALSGPALAAYQPRIQRRIQEDHAMWAARGSTFSLALHAKTSVFKVFLDVVYGVSDPEKYTGYRAQLDEYLFYVSKTSRRAPADATKIRERLLAAIVRPAIASSVARVRSGASTTCVLDAVVAQGSVSEADLVVESFQLLAMGLPGLEGLVVHTITAMVSHDDVRGQMATARDAYTAQYPNGAHWSHLEDLDAVNQYVNEVQRVYGASPRHTFARATKDLTVPDGSGAMVAVPKNRLTVALLDCINHDPKRWPSPEQFQPARFATANTSAYGFAPFAIDDLVHRVEGRREGLSRLILQSHVVSLLDFVAVMAPLQSFALGDGVNPLPIDLLTTVSFRYAPGVVQQDVDAWRRLHHPNAKLYNGSLENPLLAASDKRLDFWTHSMIQLFNVRFETWVTPTAAASIKVPTTQKTLPKRTLYGTSIQIPTEDEDVAIPKVVLESAKLLQDSAPFVDNFDAKWAPGEDMEGYVLSKVGRMWPRVRVHWDDRYSDRALELLVFHGLGQHMVQKLATAHDDGSYYTVATNFLASIEVRAGYAITGADAFFDAKGKVTKIVRLGKTIRPTDAAWEYAKMCFRSSLVSKITAVDHLMGLHVTVGNYMTTASREQLPPAHPLRRLIKPFTFRAVAINYDASIALFAPKGMLHRAFPFTEKGLKDTWAMALKSLTLEPFPVHLARQQVDTITLPYHEDGADYWKIVRTFVSEYLDLYYKSDDDVTRDASIQALWAFLNKQLPTPLGVLSLENLKDVVAHSIFLVTAMHNHLGGIAEYVSDPAFCPVSWVEGELSGRPGNAVRAALIMSGTGFPQPNILEDFSHVLLDDAAKAVAHRFTASLQAFVQVVEARNAQRILPYQAFNPLVMDMAIGI